MNLIISICVIAFCFVMIKSKGDKNKTQPLNVQNLSSDELLERAQFLLQKFQQYISNSPDYLMNKLDVVLIDSIVNDCKIRLYSLDYKQNYTSLVKQYGDIEMVVCTCFGDVVVDTYAKKSSATTKEIYTLDWLLDIVNINLKQFGLQKFYSKPVQKTSAEYLAGI